MGNKKLISAVIAAHNEELHLATCIKSLLNQSYKNIEIFVVENGDSNDKTLEIAKSFEKKYKNVHALTIPGKQKGPGNAWNYGIKKAKSDLIMICGADLIYGKDHVKKGIKYLLESKSPGIVHSSEKCHNISNLWARAFFKTRSSVDETGLAKVFTFVKKDYVKKRPFNSNLGYADDQTIFRTEGTKFPGYNLEVSQDNPASFKDTWDHSLWVGRSMSHPARIIAVLPVFPFYALYKTLNHLRTDFYAPFVLFLPVYYSIRYFAYFTECFKKLFLNKIL